MATTIQTTAEPAASGEVAIDLDAIAANWRLLAARAGVETGAVVKANAYGLGIARVAPALWRAGARRFYVAQVGEGLDLRALAPEADIVVLAPVLPEALAPARAGRLVVALNDPDALAAWRADAATSGAPVAAALHLDTGMTRLGFDDAEAAALWRTFSATERVAIVELSSHLACADEPDHPANRSQLDRFRRAARAFPKDLRRSLANSSGIFLGGDFLQTATRPGMALYGLNPTPGRPNPMQPAVELHVAILQTRRLRQAETVGYGATATAPAGGRIATIAAGYADGLHRSLSGSGAVYIEGQRAPIIGRVSMDLIAIDVTDIPENLVRPGARAEVIGRHQSADDLAAAAGSIGYEVLTNIGGRYRRSYRTAVQP